MSLESVLRDLSPPPNGPSEEPPHPGSPVALPCPRWPVPPLPGPSLLRLWGSSKYLRFVIVV